MASANENLGESSLFYGSLLGRLLLDALFAGGNGDGFDETGGQETGQDGLYKSD